VNTSSVPSLRTYFPLKRLIEESGYTRQHLMRLEREGKIPPFLRRRRGCRVFGTDEHRAALAGRAA